MVDLSWVSATVPGPHELKKNQKKVTKNMTKQLKINKQNEDVSRRSVSTHRYEVNQSIRANLNGSTSETETPL